MTEHLDVLRVFLASPGDLNDERVIAHEVVDEVNETLRPLRMHVDLLGWEDTQPGAGRPQHIINKDVDACDLFVGLMWRHWGSPTGTHSSGFEEEFERAQNRRISSGSPELWLSFKSIGDEHMEDPGPQLRRVIDFRHQQIERRAILFKEFETPAAWRVLFGRWLLTFIHERVRRDPIESSAISSPVAPTTVDLDTNTAANSLDMPVASAQLQQLAQFIRALNADTFKLSWPQTDSLVSIAHLQVIASAAMATAYPSLLLGIHEANLLYTRRKEIALAAFEHYQVVRSMIADEYRRLPGWYWFKPSDAEPLFVLAVDSDESVAKNALAILQKARIAIDTDSAKYIIVFHLTKSSAALRERVLDYLAAAADPSTIDALNEQADDGLVDASIAARLRLGDATVLGILEHRATLSERVSQAVQKYAGVLQAHDLLSATTSRHETVRAIAVNALQKSGNITDTLAFTLTRDTSAQIRSIGYAALLAGGAEIDLDEMTNALGGVDLVEKRMRLVSYYRRLPESALLAKLSFVGTDVAEIYEAIGLQYPANFLDRVRQDLGDRMETFQADWISSFSSTYPPAIAEEIEGGWSAELLSFIRSQFIAAGLRVLARRGQRSDVSSGRAYVNYEDANVRSAAVSVIARFGSAADGPVLAIVADTSYGVLPAAAAAAATKLSGNVEMVLLPLLKAANPTLIRAAIARLRKGRKDRAITVLRGLLRSDKSPTRVLAAAALVEIDRTRAEGFLDEYLEGYRFYDVVCWFDRLLFGPTWLQDAFRRDLNETFGGW